MMISSSVSSLTISITLSFRYSLTNLSMPATKAAFLKTSSSQSDQIVALFLLQQPILFLSWLPLLLVETAKDSLGCSTHIPPSSFSSFISGNTSLATYWLFACPRFSVGSQSGLAKL